MLCAVLHALFDLPPPEALIDEAATMLAADWPITVLLVILCLVPSLLAATLISVIAWFATRPLWSRLSKRVGRIVFWSATLALAVPIASLGFAHAIAKNVEVFRGAYAVDGKEGTRLAVVSTSVYRGRGGPSASAHVRVVDLERSESVARSSLHTRFSATPSTLDGQALWFSLATSDSTTDDYATVHLYSGKQGARVSEIAQKHAGARGAHRIVHGPTAGAGVLVQFQDGSTSQVSASGTLSPNRNHGNRTKAAATPLRSFVPRKISGLQRSRVAPSDCGCIAGSPCGKLVEYQSTAFGEGTMALAVLHEGEVTWTQTFEALGLDPDAEIVAVASHENRCLLVGWLPKGRTIYWLDRSEGRLTNTLWF